MREIEFRGKRTGGTEWLYGDLNQIDGKVFIMDRRPETPLNSPDWFEVDPETVGQYTGFTDSYENKLYEGDIVNLVGDGHWKGQAPNMCGIRAVVYEQSHASFFYHSFIPMSWGGWESVKKIGNIYDNPEIQLSSQ